jgi:ribosomal protein S18 acetylase RimI-like enzyme
VFGWLLPEPARRATALRQFFTIEARDVVLPHGLALAAPGGDAPPASDPGYLGAALVLPPGHWRTPIGMQARHAAEFVQIFGRRLPRAMGVLATLERRHPRDRHVYLPYIGVGPAAQGRGLGTALLAPMLARCDRDGLAAYLEASSPRNARLYERLGFRTLDTINPLGGPPLELMRREPG